MRDKLGCLLETPSIPDYQPAVRAGGDNAGMRTISREVARPLESPVELTPQRLHAELLLTGVSDSRAYLFGALHDATLSRRHGTIRFGQSDPGWLDILEMLLTGLGQRAWRYREGRTRRFWILET